MAIWRMACGIAVCASTGAHTGGAMSSTILRALKSGILVAAAAMGGSLVARAQPASPQPDVLGALLTEVRGLRSAMEAMASAGPRVQLLLGRVQLQEQRILNQTRRLDAVTASLAAARVQLEPLNARVKGLTEDLKEPDRTPGDIKGIEWELSKVKPQWALITAEVQRLAAEESYLTQDLATEQNRWTDFNQKL